MAWLAALALVTIFAATIALGVLIWLAVLDRRWHRKIGRRLLEPETHGDEGGHPAYIAGQPKDNWLELPDGTRIRNQDHIWRSGPSAWRGTGARRR